MSSLWTPSGEHPVEDDRPGGPGGPATPPSAGPPPGGPAGASGPAEGSPDAARQVEELRRQLADAPAEVVVANHCYGLFELAAVYLSQVPPLLPQARLAIDAMGSLVDGLGARLADAEPALREALAQIRLAFVQMEAAATSPPADGDGAANGAGG